VQPTQATKHVEVVPDRTENMLPGIS